MRTTYVQFKYIQLAQLNRVDEKELVARTGGAATVNWSPSTPSAGGGTPMATSRAGFFNDPHGHFSQALPSK